MIEIEIKDDLQRGLFFLPLGRNLRGRIDVDRIRDEGFQKLRLAFPKPIPGQVIGFDATTGKAWIREPLFDAEHAETRAKIEKMGYGVGTAREEFAAVDRATWAYWIKRAVDSKQASIVSGELPEVVGEPRLSMVRRPAPQDSKIDKLIGLVEALLKNRDQLATI